MALEGRHPHTSGECGSASSGSTNRSKTSPYTNKVHHTLNVTIIWNTWGCTFATVLTRAPNENSVLTLEAPEKREAESSGPIFRTDERNLEVCVRETEISLQTESAAVWGVEPRKALETHE